MSDDQDEIGDLIPHVRSLIAYNAEFLMATKNSMYMQMARKKS